MVEVGEISISKSGLDVMWRITNFFSLSEEDGADHYSPYFSFRGEEWCLVIYPNGWSERDSYGYVDLRLFRFFSDHPIRQAFSLSLKNVQGEKYNEEHFTKDYEGSLLSHGFNRFISRSELSRRQSELVPNGVLTVACSMKNITSAGSDTGNSKNTCMEASTQTREENGKSLDQNSESTCVEACTQIEEENTKKSENICLETSTQTVEENGEACASGSSASSYEKKVADDFKELFLQKEDWDIIIKIKGSEIPAHRLVLKVRSPVFASTFRHDMKENATGVVEIEDCDPSPFSDFLYFLYCGDIGMISRENVFSLFTLADKYEVMDLKVTCLDFIKKNMTINTFCETITLALQHSETELIALATNFFVENAEEILETVKWQTFAAENPTQSNELFIKFVKSVKRSNT